MNVTLLKPYHSIQELVRELVNGNRRALAKAISLVESTHPTSEPLRNELLESILPYTGNSMRIGITGSPGAGKSSLIEALGMRMIADGYRLAVLAVDPAATHSGGSILGDKLRMSGLSTRDQVFIRPSSNRGSQGVLALRTRESILVCEAAGYNVVMVETVGSGQADTDLDDVVDLVILACLPNAGDEIQGLKRGIMECADIIVVTKADLDQKATHHAAITLRSVLRLFRPKFPDWNTVVVVVSSLHGDGIETLWQECVRFFAPTRAKTRNCNRRFQLLRWFDQALRQQCITFLQQNNFLQDQIEKYRYAIEQDKLLPSHAAQKIVSHLCICRD